jgi:1-acyl-sn-glycerol-3-phosphate acyltransferase
MCNTLFKTVFLIEAIGLENIPEFGGVLLCCNHSSNFDPFVLRAKTSREINFIAKKELFQNKLISFFLKNFGAFPVDRNINDIKSYKKAIDIIKNKKEILAVFIQGTRQKELKEDNAKNGAALFALKSGATLLPVFIKSKYNFLSKVKIKIGQKINFDNKEKITREKIDELTQKIVIAIKKLSY